MLAEAYYVFPVPARAAVCSFRMQTNNGVTLEGVVKENSDAERDYEQAMSENRLAGLLEQYQQDSVVEYFSSYFSDHPSSSIRSFHRIFASKYHGYSYDISKSLICSLILLLTQSLLLFHRLTVCYGSL
jgi:hypothetical protein